MKVYNILLLAREMKVGGVERHVIDISAALKNLGHKVIVTSEGGNLVKEFETIGIKHYFCLLGSERKRISFINLTKSAIVLREIIKKERIDIIHSQSLYTTLAAFLALKICGTKKNVRIITTIHNLSSRNNFEYAIGSLILQLFSSYTIFVSNYERQKFLSKRVLSYKKTYVIPNGVDLSKFRNGKIANNFRKEWKLPNNQTLLGVIARISQEKGHKYLIEAFSKVIKKIPDAKLVIIGDGPLKSDIEALVESLRVTQNVIFTGFRKDIPEILKCLDVFVLPSLWESLPIVILEAMAAKVPVIATDVGGVSEIIRDKKTGLLIPPKDAEAIFNAVIRLFMDIDLREKITENAYELVKSKFSLPGIAIQIKNVYDELMLWG